MRKKVLQESAETTVERVLTARQDLREAAEAEVAAEAAASASSGGGGDALVPSLEELVAEKAEELRTRLLSRGADEEEPPEPSPPLPPPPPVTRRKDGGGDPGAAVRPGVDALLPAAAAAAAVADAGWPWPAEWLAAPRVPPPPPPFTDVDVLGQALGENFVDLDAAVAGLEDGGGRANPPVPHSIEVAAVEVADAEDPDAAHIEVRCGCYIRE